MQDRSRSFLFSARSLPCLFLSNTRAYNIALSTPPILQYFCLKKFGILCYCNVCGHPRVTLRQVSFIQHKPRLDPRFPFRKTTTPKTLRGFCCLFKYSPPTLFCTNSMLKKKPPKNLRRLCGNQTAYAASALLCALFTFGHLKMYERAIQIILKRFHSPKNVYGQIEQLFCIAYRFVVYGIFQVPIFKF